MSPSSSNRSLVPASRAPGSPPAVWTAFARQGRWKSWALLASFALNFFLATAAIGLVRRPPDVVLVDPSGKSTYVNRSIAGDELVRFLDEQRQRPSDITVVHFTTSFLNAFLAVNSTTIDAAWPAALEMMSPPLRERMSNEASAQKLVETYKLAGVRTELRIEDIALVERHGELFHVRATVSRRKTSLQEPSRVLDDRLEVELVERSVARTAARPDGLEISGYQNRVLPSPTEGVPGTSSPAAP